MGKSLPLDFAQLKNCLTCLFLAVFIFLPCFPAEALDGNPEFPQDLIPLSDFDSSDTNSTLQGLRDSIRQKSSLTQFITLAESGVKGNFEETQEIISNAEKGAQLLSEILLTQNSEVASETTLVKLFDAYLFATGTIPGREVGTRILFRLLQKGSPIQEIFSFARFLRDDFHYSLQENSDFYKSFTSLSLEDIKAIKFLFLIKSDIDKDINLSNIVELAKKNALNPFVQFSTAKALINAGKFEEGKNHLAKAIALNPEYKAKIISDADFRNANFCEFQNSNLFLDRLSSKSSSEIESATIQFSWNGLNKPVEIIYKLKKEEGFFVEEKDKRKIPCFLINALIAELEKSPVSSFPVMVRNHFDDYPELLIRLYNKKTLTASFYSSSNTPEMLPFNAWNKKELRLIETKAFGTTISLLKSWLDIHSPEPAATSFQSGDEVPLKPFPENSPLDLIFRDEAQIQAKADYQPELPAELKSAGFSSFKIEESKLNGCPSSIKRIALDFIEPGGMKTVRMIFHQLTIRGKTSWFLGSPQNFIASAKKAIEALSLLMPYDFETIEISPDIDYYENSGQPVLANLFKAAEMLAVSYSSSDEFMGEPVPLKIVSRPASSPIDFIADYFPKSEKIILNYWSDIPSKNGIYELFFEWLGLSEKSTEVKKLTFDEGKFILEYDKEPDEKTQDLFFKKGLEKRLRQTLRDYKNSYELIISSGEKRLTIIKEKKERPGIFLRVLP
ncbi:MAG: hypothetical protein HQM08_11290 [Candidatus Riflebacteria bacterium]|nr:hypothetical protein [Candidatus Riflebacteria bacterium]